MYTLKELKLRNKNAFEHVSNLDDFSVKGSQFEYVQNSLILFFVRGSCFFYNKSARFGEDGEIYVAGKNMTLMARLSVAQEILDWMNAPSDLFTRKIETKQDLLKFFEDVDAISFKSKEETDHLSKQGRLISILLDDK